MNQMDLGLKLKEMYEGASQGEAVAMIHLFGIRFAGEIRAGGYTVKDVISASGINQSFKTELSKGIKLAKYVRSIDG